MREAHRVLAKIEFSPVALERGYANRTLRVDLSARTLEFKPVTDEMKRLWVGGKGFDLWLMFQEINKDSKWDSPENPICLSSGPLGGTTSFPGSGKTLVTALSPLTGSVMDSNVGGYFGPFMKFAGMDAITIVGKSTDEVVLVIDAVSGVITIESAPEESVDSHLVCEELTEMYADDELDRRNIAVVAAGRGADHTRMGVLNFSFYDWRRQVARLKQSGRGGIGTVFRNKNLKALVLKNKGITPAWRIAESKVAHLTRPSKIHVQCKSEEEEIKDIAGHYNYDPEYV
ncbi:aldehyde:ferredoxin oxidoreductase, partial [Myxococcota bacterium]|nr:aldehyde:ferredoxin oxidoreductase [Myxococcota bacterium]